MLANKEDIMAWSYGEITKPEETINAIELLDLKKTDFLMKEFLDQRKIGNVIVESTKESDIEE